jgi:D-arabinan exo alpha-(1,3)/(1,5)-arabinofuranosidase (non-reducing end)
VLTGAGAGAATVALGALAAESSANAATSLVSSSLQPGGTLGDVLNPTYIDTRLDSRSISFENPSGARSSGGKLAGGRKGRPAYIFDPGEKVVLADISGPGTLRHIWMTLGQGPPELMRSLRLEVFYDGLPEPSVSVPVLDFFGLPHGRWAEYYSALMSVNEGRGLNCHIPMPFGRSVRVEFTNDSSHYIVLYYQIDYTLEPFDAQHTSYLHAQFRRENPTTPGRDFVIAEGFEGPGRFLGCSVGVRVLDKDNWYGEGEVKIYRDGDVEFPTYCGTGLEDYVGSAWALARHSGLYAGAPLNIPASANARTGPCPDYLSFYRWHLPDPIMFSNDFKITIQQIGAASFNQGQEAAYDAFKSSHQSAGRGWTSTPDSPMIGVGLFERRDDYCATAWVYCRKPRPVTRFDARIASGDVGLLPSEKLPEPEMPLDAVDKLLRDSKRQLKR